MIGFGKYHYEYESDRRGESSVVGFFQEKINFRFKYHYI